MKWSAYWRLMRIHKPIGILLLWYPTAWALWFANHGQPSVRLISLFFLGTFFMRSAGCVLNDIADRDIDKHVSRTQSRPLTSGELTLNQALALLFILLSVSLLILLQLPWSCFFCALLALGMVIVYPFTKRFIQSPQLVLGLTFSMGIPMAFFASGQSFSLSMGCLYLINLLWIVAYDTEYAMTDRVDDLRIGVKSTAVLFGSYDRLIIGILQVSLQALWLGWIISCTPSLRFYTAWVFGCLILIYQQQLLATRQEDNYFNAFSSNHWYGLVMWVPFILT